MGLGDTVGEEPDKSLGIVVRRHGRVLATSVLYNLPQSRSLLLHCPACEKVDNAKEVAVLGPVNDVQSIGAVGQKAAPLAGHSFRRFG